MRSHRENGIFLYYRQSRVSRLGLPLLPAGIQVQREFSRPKEFSFRTAGQDGATLTVVHRGRRRQELWRVNRRQGVIKRGAGASNAMIGAIPANKPLDTGLNRRRGPEADVANQFVDV